MLLLSTCCKNVMFQVYLSAATRQMGGVAYQSMELALQKVKIYQYFNNLYIAYRSYIKQYNFYVSVQNTSLGIEVIQGCGNSSKPGGKEVLLNSCNYRVDSFVFACICNSHDGQVVIVISIIWSDLSQVQ